MSKVLIVTDEEIASYALAHQERLLDALTALAEEYPNATKEELFEYARRELTINPSQTSLPSYKALKELPALTAPPRQEEQIEDEADTNYPIEEPTVVVEPPVTNWEEEDEEDTSYSSDLESESSDVAPEPEPVVEEPWVAPEIEEPVAIVEPAVPTITEEELLQAAYDTAVRVQEQLPVYVEPEPAVEEPWSVPAEDFVPPPIEEAPGNIAFRQKKFKGLFQEASKLDK